MTQRETAEFVLRHGNCIGLDCRDCFMFPRRDNSTYHAACQYICLRSNETLFRSRVIAAKYLAELNDNEEDK